MVSGPIRRRNVNSDGFSFMSAASFRREQAEQDCDEQRVRAEDDEDDHGYSTPYLARMNATTAFTKAV
jgi:hypothetical protein